MAIKRKHFRYRDIDELRAEIEKLGLSIRLENRIDKLLEPVRVGHKTVGNALGIPPNLLTNIDFVFILRENLENYILNINLQ